MVFFINLFLGILNKFEVILFRDIIKNNLSDNITNKTNIFSGMIFDALSINYII